MRTPHLDWLRRARIELPADADHGQDSGARDSGAKDAGAAIEPLCDEALVEAAAVHFDERGLNEEAAALRHYLAARWEGRWTPLHEAAVLAGLVTRAEAERRQAEADSAAAEAARQEPPPKPKGFFAAVKGLFGGRE
jgi:hypothetical protein